VITVSSRVESAKLHTRWACACVLSAAALIALGAPGSAAATTQSSSTGGTEYRSPPAAGSSQSLAIAARQLGKHRLKRGARGDEVRVLQMWLSELGYQVRVNGRYDRRTERAVKRFQSDEGMDGDGVAGRSTIATLRSARSAHQAVAGADSWVFPIKPVARVAPPSYWSEDQGIDIPPFSGFCGRQTMLVAVTDGRIVEEGIGGFGSQSPILRVAHGQYAGRYIYYGHSQPALVKVGAYVHAGQPIAEVGCGRVGISEAPHLEIGISRRHGPTCCPGFGETSPLIKAIMLELYRRAH